LRPLLPKTLETPPKNNNNRSTHKFTEPKREGLAVCVGVYTVPVCILYYYYMCTLLYYCYYYIRLGGSKDGKQVKQKPHRRRMIHRCETHILIYYMYIVITIINTMVITIVRRNYDDGDETVRLPMTFEQRGFNIIYI